MPPEPHRPTDPPPAPVEPDRPAHDVKHGAFDDSVAGEEDPGASVDMLAPRRQA